MTTIRTGFWQGTSGTDSCFGPNHRTQAKPPAQQPLTVGKLPKSHAISKAAEPIAQEWLDANIASSDIGIDAGLIKNRGAIGEKSLQGLTEKLLRDGYKHFEDVALPKDAKLTTRILPNVAGAVAQAAKLVCDDGFVYAPQNREGRSGVLAQVKQLVGKLGAAKDVVALGSQTRAHTAVLDDKVKVSIFLFANQKTGEYVEFFVREGSM